MDVFGTCSFVHTLAHIQPHILTITGPHPPNTLAHPLSHTHTHTHIHTHTHTHTHTHMHAQVSPMSGEVLAGQKEVVRLKVCAGIPDRLMETLHVELAHFDPIHVQVCCDSVAVYVWSRDGIGVLIGWHVERAHFDPIHVQVCWYSLAVYVWSRDGIGVLIGWHVERAHFDLHPIHVQVCCDSVAVYVWSCDGIGV